MAGSPTEVHPFNFLCGRIPYGVQCVYKQLYFVSCINTYATSTCPVMHAASVLLMVTLRSSEHTTTIILYYYTILYYTILYYTIY